MRQIELVDADAVAGSGDGVQWALESSADLNANLVWLEPGHGIGEHVNDSVDVLVVVLDGAGTVTIDGDARPVSTHVVVHVPQGTGRRIDAGPDGLRYLTVHRRRGPLSVGPPRR